MPVDPSQGGVGVDEIMEMKSYYKVPGTDIKC